MTSTMRFSQIRKMDISNGEGIGVALFTQGCPFHCKNCFNSETWDFDLGEEWTEKMENAIIYLLKSSHIHRLTILGGEPLIERNIEPLTKLLTRVRAAYPEKKLWLYTGRLFEEALKLFPQLISLLDILIDGRYVDEKRDPRLKWRGSSNQRVLDVQASLKEKKPVLYIDDLQELQLQP